MIQTTTFTLTDPDGFEIFVYRWAPPPGTSPKAVVQLAHGAAEHALRYERFARYLNQAGYTVYADDHRGHGKTASTLDKAGIAGEDGWNGMVRDLRMITDCIQHDYPDLPLFLFGHSMGSFLAQRYIQLWGEGLKGVVLSGTSGSLGDVTAMVALLEQAVQAQGRGAPSELFIQMFAGFSAPFPPVRTGFEWLSRDEAEVQKYVDDPWCGFPFSNGLVLDMFKGAADIWCDESESRIPKDLPVLMVSGALDPVGANTAAVNLLAQRYQAQGIHDLTVKFYENARHELLNETNRDDVQEYLLDWLDEQIN
jgi:alpha-beta hydrolase superfamily lysophospholipase